MSTVSTNSNGAAKAQAASSLKPSPTATRPVEAKGASSGAGSVVTDRTTRPTKVNRAVAPSVRPADRRPTAKSAASTPPPPTADARIGGPPIEPSGGARSKIGGVIAFTGPPTWWDRLRQRKAFERRGFVPLSPGRPKLRHRILPRSVIGISTMLMSVGIGAAFSGAAFYAYYDNRLAANEQEVARFVEGFDQQFTDAASALEDLRGDSINQIRSELVPLTDYVADANAVVGLPQQIGDSVWLLQTRDDGGRQMVGSAFAVAEHREGTALLTSYSLVNSSTVSPGPGIQLTKEGETITATLWSWDAARDLALVVTDRKITPLDMADPDVQAESVGGRVFAMSGLGGQGATASPGVLLDRSAIGLQHTAVVGAAFVGGPLVDGDGVILGVASGNYRPIGVDPGAVSQAPDIPGICAEILSCAEAPAPSAESAPVDKGG